MHALNSLRTANLLIFDLSRAAAAPSGLQPMPLGRNVQRAASGDSGATAQAGLSPLDDVFSVNHVDANEMKVKLYERVGKAFGFELDDFKDAAAMAREIDKIVKDMTHDEIVAIETELGLDELGVTLHEVLEAMKEPGGDSDLKLQAALREEAGELVEEQQGSARSDPYVWFDDIGRYAV